MTELITNENPLADLANQLGTVRVIWGFLSALLVAIGVDITFINPDFFSVDSFDQIVSGIVTIAGIVFTYYQAYVRKVVVTPGVKAQSDYAKVRVGFAPFGNVVV